MSSALTVKVDSKSHLWSFPVEELGATKQNRQEPDMEQTKGSWSLASPQEGMIVTDSLTSSWETKLLKSLLQKREEALAGAVN